MMYHFVFKSVSYAFIFRLIKYFLVYAFSQKLIDTIYSNLHLSRCSNDHFECKDTNIRFISHFIFQIISIIIIFIDQIENEIKKDEKLPLNDTLQSIYDNEYSDDFICIYESTKSIFFSSFLLIDKFKLKSSGSPTLKQI